MPQLKNLLTNPFRRKQNKRKILEILEAQKLEVAISLSDLIALSLDGQVYERFFDNLFQAIDAENPFYDYKPDDSAVKCFDGLVVLYELEADYLTDSLSNGSTNETNSLSLKGLSLKEFKETTLKKISESFERLKEAYKALSREMAGEFVNKPLNYVRRYHVRFSESEEETEKPKDERLKDETLKYERLKYERLKNERLKDEQLMNKKGEDEKLKEFILAARDIPLQPDSGFLNNGCWTLLQERIEKDFTSRIESLEKVIDTSGLNKKYAKQDDKNDAGNNTPILSIIKTAIQTKTIKYRGEVLRRITQSHLMSLLASSQFNIGQVNTENYWQLTLLAHEMVKEGALILPRPSAVTAHTERDLNDLIEFQFPDDKQYLIEEVSNSRDAKADYVRFDFYQNGLTIEDNGIGMPAEFFFKRYSLPYITLKNGRIKIGRFGVGAKAKLVEVLKHNNVIYVETRDESIEGEEAFRQRYFMHNSSLYVGFSKSELKQSGTRISIVSNPKIAEERVKAMKAHIEDKVEYVEPNFGIIVEGKQVNAESITESIWHKEKDNVFVLDYKGEKARVYFKPVLSAKEQQVQQKGKMVFLSGENKICAVPSPFFAVVEIPLQFQPVEGRDDFVYTQDLCRYLSSVFDKVMLPALRRKYHKKEYHEKGSSNQLSVKDEKQSNNQLSIEECAYWFLNTRINQNPFYYFEQLADKESIIQFYRLLYPSKEITISSNIVGLLNEGTGSIGNLNKIIPRDLFIARRTYSPAYVMSLDEYIRLNEMEKETKEDEPIKRCEEIMASIYGNHRNGFWIRENKVCLDDKPVKLLCLDELNHDGPFYFDRANCMLIINVSHKGFTLPQREREFYLTEMLRITENE